MSAIKDIDNNFLDLTDPFLIKALLFGGNCFDTNANTKVVDETVECVLSTKRFGSPLFQRMPSGIVFEFCF